MKITVAEWRQFEDEGWPPGYIWADESTLDDGREIESLTNPNEVFIVPDWWGCVFEGGNTEGSKEICRGEGFSIRSLIRKWRKAKTNVTIAVTVPRDQEAEARELFKSKKWKVEV